MNFMRRSWFLGICIVFLIFSAISPSIVVAADIEDLESRDISLKEVEEVNHNETEIQLEEEITEDESPTNNQVEPDEHMIKINFGEGRTNLRGEGRIVGEGNTQYMNIKYLDEGIALVPSENNWIPEGQYELIISLGYMENGTKYQYIDTWLLSGDQLKQFNEINIPNENQLLKSSLNYGEINYNDSYVRLKFDNGNEWSISGDYIVSTTLLNGQIFINGKAPGKRYLLEIPWTIGQSIDFESPPVATSEIIVEDLAARIDLNNVNGNIKLLSI